MPGRQPVVHENHLAAYLFGVAHGVAVVISGTLQHKASAVEIEKTGHRYGEILGTEEETGDVRAVIADDLMARDLQRLVPPQCPGRLHVLYRHGEKLLGDGGAK